MDISTKSIVCTTLDEDGNIVRKDNIENSFEKLGEFLDSFSPGDFRRGIDRMLRIQLRSDNIIRKAIPEAFANLIEGIGLYSRSLSIRQMITPKSGC